MSEYFYIHIPFCRQKCGYCKFALTPVFDNTKKRRYFAHLHAEITRYFQEKDTQPIKTIYFGGGTPSILERSELQEILDCFPGITRDTEITLEANPEDITPAYAEVLRSLGITRVSLGVQTLNDESLRSIGRSMNFHTHAALKNLEQAGIQNINIDMILGLPHVSSGETLRNIQDLHTAYKHITHTSVYILEKGHYPKSWKNHTLKDTAIERDFLEIIDFFVSNGWHHYEFSNFAKRGYESIHNQAYWDHSPYRGFGLSAASFEDTTRWSNSESFAGYYRHEKITEELLDRRAIQIEKLMFGLRTNTLLEDDVLNIRGMDRLTQEGLLQKHGKNVFLTKTGIFLLDYIISELI